MTGDLGFDTALNGEPLAITVKVLPIAEGVVKYQVSHNTNLEDEEIAFILRNVSADLYAKAKQGLDDDR